MVSGDMLHPRIDISRDLEGEPIVLACFDLGPEEIAALSHAVAAMAAERFRHADMSVDDVLELRELTALADELAHQDPQPGLRTLVLRPARLSGLRDSVARFTSSSQAIRRPDQPRSCSAKIDCIFAILSRFAI